MSDHGVNCSGGCGKKVVPVTADDASFFHKQTWYCNDCYDIEFQRRQRNLNK